MKLGKRIRIIIALLISICLIIGVPLLAYGGEDDVRAEVRELLKENYVRTLTEDVLDAPTVKEMLAKLGDRHTQYMTKNEYEAFINSLDMSFSGVGIELVMVPQGVMVTKVFDGYGAAKAGIKTGDIITSADGYSFAGKTSEACVAKLRGPEKTKVRLQVKRNTNTLFFNVERMLIELPVVESAVLEDHIGYIAVYSFGLDTVALFDKQARALKEKGVDSWIIDLRSNGGGYTQAAIQLLGYIIGENHAVIMKDRSIISYVYQAEKQEYTLEGPVILLTDGYTGSSSEIVTAAIKDHSKAAIIGETTIGSGRVKALMPLSNGDYLKMTVNMFYSPNGNPIDEVGVKPHMDLSGVDELKTAVLLLKEMDKNNDEDTGDKAGYVQWNIGSEDFAVSLEELKKPENWKIGRKMLDSAYVTTTMRLGGLKGWEAFPEVWLKERHKLYYQGYAEAGNLQHVPLDKIFTVTFNADMDWQSVNSDSIELINSATGERVDCDFTYVQKRVMKVAPKVKLSADSEYWLVIHPVLKDAEGRNITGGVALAKTVK